MELTDLKDKAAIVGVGYSERQGTVPGVTVMRLALEACKDAIEDAGLKKEDIDGLLLQPVMGATHSYNLAAHLGMHLRFTANEDAMGASGGFIAQSAAMAVASGLANYVLCVYATTSQSGGIGMTGAGRGPGPGPRGGAVLLNEGALYGVTGAAMSYALAARQGMRAFGTGPETWVDIAMNTRKWANLNPRATFYQRTMSRDDYFAEPWIAEPFRRADCCLVSDGARAFIVTTSDRAKSLKQPPVYISGMGQYHHTEDIVQSMFAAGPTGARESGAAALKMAGIKLSDIDACEIYDCFTYTVELTMQSYGFFGPGEGKDFFKNGRTAPGGDFPVNTSGGLLSEVYYMGFTPLTEAVMQLRGQCGERQIEDPEYVLVSGNGGILQTHSTLILRR
jgi:acetyl-CoA acetyltransferase